jgi:uncharacterized protein (DUF305 family)
MPDENQKPLSPARATLAASEAEIARLHDDMVRLRKAQALDTDVMFRPEKGRAHDDAIALTQAELDMAENRRATCLADVRAEDAERESAALKETNRRLTQAAEDSAAAASRAAEAVREQVNVGWFALGVSILSILIALATLILKK